MKESPRIYSKAFTTAKGQLNNKEEKYITQTDMVSMIKERRSFEGKDPIEWAITNNCLVESASGKAKHPLIFAIDENLYKEGIAAGYLIHHRDILRAALEISDLYGSIRNTTQNIIADSIRRFIADSGANIDAKKELVEICSEYEWIQGNPAPEVPLTREHTPVFTAPRDVGVSAPVQNTDPAAALKGRINGLFQINAQDSDITNFIADISKAGSNVQTAVAQEFAELANRIYKSSSTQVDAVLKVWNDDERVAKVDTTTMLQTQLTVLIHGDEYARDFVDASQIGKKQRLSHQLKDEEKSQVNKLFNLLKVSTTQTQQAFADEIAQILNGGQETVKQDYSKWEEGQKDTMRYRMAFCIAKQWMEDKDLNNGQPLLQALEAILTPEEGKVVDINIKNVHAFLKATGERGGREGELVTLESASMKLLQNASAEEIAKKLIKARLLRSKLHEEVDRDGLISDMFGKACETCSPEVLDKLAEVGEAIAKEKDVESNIGFVGYITLVVEELIDALKGRTTSSDISKAIEFLGRGEGKSR